ncbi:MAG: nitronate monooxygenase [Actinobacteria bacterium]|nr:nitronate monooxygenase [Actinomycetota bacterium]
MKTRLTEMLGIELPVMLAGMGGVSYSDLVIAVSEAGGIGTFGAAPMSTELLVEEMARVRAATSKPFGVDLLTASPDSVARNIRAVIEGGASIYVAGLGVPSEVVDELHRHNILVGSVCGKVRHAVAAVESGCDFVVAQGTEAGGHTGQIATMALVPQVVDAVKGKVPVVAAGGLFDGRGLVASLALGAEGVWMGTRFIATHEAHTGRGFKERMLETPEDGTVISKGYTGKTCRVIRTEWTNHFEQHPEELKPFPQQVMTAMQAGVQQLGTGPDVELDTNRAFMACGQAVGAIDAIKPARQVVEEIMDDARRTLKRLAAIS